MNSPCLAVSSAIVLHFQKKKKIYNKLLLVHLTVCHLYFIVVPNKAGIPCILFSALVLN